MIPRSRSRPSMARRLATSRSAVTPRLVPPERPQRRIDEFLRVRFERSGPLPDIVGAEREVLGGDRERELKVARRSLYCDDHRREAEPHDVGSEAVLPRA